MPRSPYRRIASLAPSSGRAHFRDARRRRAAAVLFRPRQQYPPLRRGSSAEPTDGEIVDRNVRDGRRPSRTFDAIPFLPLADPGAATTIRAGRTMRV